MAVPVQQAPARHSSLREFIQEHRARINPAAYGFSPPEGRGRRARGKGLTQSQLAELLDIHPRRLGRAERGEVPFSQSEKSKLAEVLKLTPDECFELYELAGEPLAGLLREARSARATARPGTGAASMHRPKPQIDTSRPNSARVYDYLLGGKDNYPIDREVGDLLPDLAREGAHVNRAFMHRTVDWLARRGVHQFLDIGTGIPTEPNLHQIAQSTNPSARIVYVDNEPIVLRHAEALLISRAEGFTGYIEADARDPEQIIEQASTLLDLRQPVGLSMIGLLHFLPDADDPYAIVRFLIDALPAGSYLTLSQGASDINRETVPEVEDGYAAGGISLSLRTKEQFTHFFDGLDIQDPGIVNASEWYHDGPVPIRSEAGLYGGVGLKP